MALPTQNDLKTLHLTLNGEPFCNICAHPSIIPDTLEYTFNGAPWWGHDGTIIAPPTPAGFNIFLGNTQVQKIYLGENEVTKAYLGSNPL
jgi:hypothetical protein